jgi:aspartyl-tRNA(Asn)/glutamyl-tRNA(Gln) amidotransferase subunit A
MGLLLGYDLGDMSEETLSSGQRALLAALEALDDLDPGAAEPAAVFRPVAWVPAQTPGFDLAALAGDEAPPEGGAERAVVAPPPAAELPPACAGVVESIAAVTRGESTATDLLERAQGRIEACNGALNAFITLCPERAAAEARAVDEVVAAGERPRPLAGVTLAHKDIIATAGVRTTAGSALLRDHVPAEDATVAARLANAGTVLAGKTNTHEFATGTTGTVSYFGAVRNPWNREHVTGGSSSGSAAALAAGMVAAATGTDTGGSIRIPAACCGIVGLKPTYGRVSRSGVVPFAWGLDHVGPMARCARDAAVLLTAMAGPDPYDRAAAAEPGADFTAGIDGGIAGLRFALPERHFLEHATAPVAAAVRAAGAVLEELGARPVEVALPDDLALVGPAAVALFLAEGGAVHRRTLLAHPAAYCDETRAFLALAGHVDAGRYLQAQRLRARLSDALATLFQKIDLLVTPTLPVTAPRLDQRVIDGPDEPVDVRAALTLFTRPFNLTGLPALSLPCGFHDGLPVGLQLVGRPFDEAVVLRAAHAYEAATGWHQQRPPEFP